MSNYNRMSRNAFICLHPAGISHIMPETTEFDHAKPTRDQLPTMAAFDG